VSKEDLGVATPEECATAVTQLAARLGESEGTQTGGLDRSVSARITDLELVYVGHLHDGVLDDIEVIPDGGDVPKAQLRLAMSSDDLLALAAGELSMGHAWLSGRIKVQASVTDLLRLRTML
jgi:hypothetical protein